MSSSQGARRTHKTLRSVGSQLAFALVTLLLLSMITFWATGRDTESVAVNALGREVTPEQVQEFIDQNQLDDPLPVRYVRWLGDFVQGDWGTSYVTGRPVREDIQPRLTKTVTLAIIALVLSIPVALGIAVFMARRPGSPADLSVLTGTTVITALPEFVIAIALVLIFSIWLGWLPADSSALTFGSPSEKVQAYILPVVTLMLVAVPYTIRIARGAVRESLAAPYTQAALLRGLPRRTVLWGHAVRGAAVPIVNTVALNLVYLISGVVVVEAVFAFPGIGARLVEAVAQSDTITVQAIALVMGAMFITITFIADLVVVYFNPKLRAR